MFGFQYLKSNPTDFVLHHANGRLAHSGAGLAFFYFKATSSIALVPVGSVDAPFIFKEMTADFQPVTLQGQVTYRVVDPERVATLLNYSIKDKNRAYVSDDPEKLPLRVIGLVQEFTRGAVQAKPLTHALKASDEVSRGVFAALAESPALAALGIAVISVSITAITATPEMSRALEAQAREQLLKASDDAIYLRRNNAVEQERGIKENELRTEIAVEEKKRQIRETKAAADLAEQEILEAQLAGRVRLEEERKQLVAGQAENARAKADARAYDLEAMLKPLQSLDHALVQALAAQSTDPRVMVSIALKALADNAAKIGQLTITPELMGSMMK
jgi:SPFH domain / Band 7 family